MRGPSQALAFSPDGKLLAAAESLDGPGPHQLRVWDVRRRQLTDFRARTAANLIAFSPDGELIAAAATDRGTEILDARTGDLVERLEVGNLAGEGDFSRSVAFSPDGNLLLVGQYNGTGRLFSTETWKQVGRPLRAHTARITFPEFSPDGRTLITAAADGTVILWDVATQKQIGAPIEVEANSFVSAALSPDGKRLYAISAGEEWAPYDKSPDDGISFDMSPDAWKRHACAVAGRDISAGEWDAGAARAALPVRLLRRLTLALRADYRRLAGRERPVTAAADPAVDRPQGAVSDREEHADVLAPRSRRAWRPPLPARPSRARLAVSGASADPHAIDTASREANPPYVVAPPPSSIAASRRRGVPGPAAARQAHAAPALRPARWTSSRWPTSRPSPPGSTSSRPPSGRSPRRRRSGVDGCPGHCGGRRAAVPRAREAGDRDDHEDTCAGPGLLAALAALLAVAAAPARADTVTDWNQTAANVLIGTAPPLQPPQITVPHLAMVHGAVYDAVNAIDGGHEGYLLSAEGRAGRPTRKDAAAAVAAHRVLVRLVPAQQACAGRAAGVVADRDPGWTLEEARHRRRRGRGGRDDRCADRRRPLRDSRIPGWHGSGCLAAGAAGVRERPERLAQGRRPVPDPELVAVPLGRAVSAHEPQVRA